MSISFQTNIASLIAGLNLNTNNNFQTQTITRLTSGYRINDSGDDAAGLAVANGYAANIAQLQQGILNANEGVTSLQIIDGGLSNISSMLNRMETLATESASTTFTGNRATLDEEYQTLIGEINREAGNIGLGTTNPTNATNLQVFIGGGASSSAGSEVNINLSAGLVDAKALGLTGTTVKGLAPVTLGSSAATAVAAAQTETFKVNTVNGSSTFTITGQAGDTVDSQLARLNADLSTVGLTASLDSTGKLAFQSGTAFSAAVTGSGLAAGTEVGINTSLNNQALTYNNTDDPATYTITEGSTTADITLASGMTDSAALASINAQLQSSGITDIQAVADGSGTTGALSLQGFSAFATAVTGTTTGTAGTFTSASGSGGALGAVNAVTAAVQNLGKVQGLVGAGENDLTYSIGLANSQVINFSGAQSAIRDASVATEAANLTKTQVLEQATVAAMAQANSSPQAVLALLKGA
jgi:flagellin